MQGLGGFFLPWLGEILETIPPNEENSQEETPLILSVPYTLDLKLRHDQNIDTNFGRKFALI